MSTDPELSELSINPQSPRVTIASAYKDAATGALWVHKDLAQVVEPWEVEEHVGPPVTDEVFGDVESWASYVKHFAGASDSPPFLTWNSYGLFAVLDYHEVNHGSTEGRTAGRLQWRARAPFHVSSQWKKWMDFANNTPRGQRETVEELENFGGDVIEPDQSTLMGILRSLRASVSATATSDLQPDGGSLVTYTNQKTVRSGNETGEVKLPPELVIQIPVLKGHVTESGAPMAYKIRVKMRVNVLDDGRLSFRFSIPKADVVLEEVYAKRVSTAQAALDNTGYTILRAG